MSLFRALHAELLKLKRTLAFRVIFVLPLLVALLQFFVIWQTKKTPAEFDLWQTHAKNSLQIWAVFMMPLLITLETALLNGIEHSDRQWKHIFALPIRRHSVYLSKFIVAQLASWLIIALHTWISIRWAGFPITLGAGIGGTFFALFAASAKLGKYYPWLLPMNVFVDGRFRMALILGAGGGIIAALVACAELARRDLT